MDSLLALPHRHTPTMVFGHQHSSSNLQMYSHHPPWLWHHLLFCPSSFHLLLGCCRTRSDWFLWPLTWMPLYPLGHNPNCICQTTRLSHPLRHWSQGLCLQLLHLSHKMWLFCNQQIQLALHLAQSQELETSICQTISLGLQHLLPQDQFYVSQVSPSEGFSLQYVLSLPLPDQHLWLTAIQNARSCSSQISHLEITKMSNSLCHWLQHTT